MKYHSDETFNSAKIDDLSDGPAEFEICVFRNCNFSESDLSDFKFIECEFYDCDLSNVKVSQAMINDVRFFRCKMLGVQFDTCKSFGFSVKCEDCQIDHSVFYQLDLKRSGFKGCHMHGVDFTGADLTKDSLEDCDLTNTMFENTNLEQADLRGAFNYNIDPNTNRIKGAKFSVSGLPGLLQNYGIEIFQG